MFASLNSLQSKLLNEANRIISSRLTAYEDIPNTLAHAVLQEDRDDRSDDWGVK